jgi:hypothetical protein
MNTLTALEDVVTFSLIIAHLCFYIMGKEAHLSFVNKWHSFLDNVLNISVCPWEEDSINTGHYVMCTLLATKCICLVRNWTSPRPICLSLHHVFPLPSCWVEFHEIRYHGFAKHCLRVVSFVHISLLQYKIFRTLSEIKFLYQISSKGVFLTVHHGINLFLLPICCTLALLCNICITLDASTCFEQ